MSGNWIDAIERARRHSPFLTLGLDRQPELEGLLRQGRGEEALAWARGCGDAAPDIETALRYEKWGLATALAIGDLAGGFSLSRVMEELSGLADRALDAAIADAILARTPDAEPTGFVALALGKHGAGELNYSSDIDPILIYDPDKLPRRERDDPGEAAQRVARKLVETLARHNGDGYVFRVDLRLRPASEVSPLAISFNAALTHYESSALAWERAAFIRARASSGDIALGEEFLGALRPFVWRKSLDFGAIGEIARLIRRIRDDHQGPVRPGPGYDLKKGRGGIREIEFFAQTHQLIYGGRKPSLRLRGTRAALDALAAEGLIASGDAHLLGESYDRLRVIEHRLQMVADQQTHALPEKPEALENVALLDGHSNAATLIEEIAAITAEVGARFDALVERTADAAGNVAAVAPERSLSAQLDKAGFDDAEDVQKRIASWTDGSVRALRSEAALSAFDAIRGPLLEALASAPEPDRALARWETFLVNMSSGINLFRLLEARPALLGLLVRILSLAPPLADALSRRPDLFDALIDASALDLPGDVASLVALMTGKHDGDDYQSQLDRVRRIVGETRFALGVQLIDAAQDPLAIAAALSRTAEAALLVSADAARAEFERAHGVVPGSELLVLGLGRFGGGALTHASDLDLVYLFSDGAGQESDGARPLGATVYFNRMSQRVTGALSVPTAEGALYEVDTRLRPQGAQGPLAVSIDSFVRYQRESAWTWEHMALTRARPLYGPPELRVQVQSIIRDVLTAPRDPAKLRDDVLAMRSEMATHKPGKGPLDAKLARGGLVDLEFLVHHQQLAHGVGLEPGLRDAVEQLCQARLLPESLLGAHDLLARLLVASRLLAPDTQMPAVAAQTVLAEACGAADMDGLLAQFNAARRAVADAWKGTFGLELETDDD
jgi:glutamate-ammonia-ligase adenylyltransferase